MFAKRRRPRAWTAEDQSRAEELRAQGLGWRRIGKAIGRDASTVKYHLSYRYEQHKHKWRPEEIEHALEMRAQGKTFEEIGALVGRSAAAVRVRLSRIRHPEQPWWSWTQDEKERAIGLHAAGWSAERIGCKLKRPPRGVRCIIARHRAAVLADPRKRRVLQALSFATDPGRILAALRKARILETDPLEECADDVRL